MVPVLGLPAENVLPNDAASPAPSLTSQDTIKDYLYYQTWLEMASHLATRGDSQAAIRTAIENLEYVNLTSDSLFER
jgi:hypothetical protein